MTKNISASLFLFILLLVCIPATQAQQKDFQFWPSANIDLGIKQKPEGNAGRRSAVKGKLHPDGKTD